MASKRIHAVFSMCAIGAIVFFTIIPNQALAKSRRPISDNEIREKKNQCYEDIESGLWGWQCKSSMIAKENCALRCLSPTCFELIYEGDPLEEGEKDYFRSQEYKYCMHKRLCNICHKSAQHIPKKCVTRCVDGFSIICKSKVITGREPGWYKRFLQLLGESNIKWK